MSLSLESSHCSDPSQEPVHRREHPSEIAIAGESSAWRCGVFGGAEGRAQRKWDGRRLAYLGVHPSWNLIEGSRVHVSQLKHSHGEICTLDRLEDGWVNHRLVWMLGMASWDWRPGTLNTLPVLSLLRRAADLRRTAHHNSMHWWVGYLHAQHVILSACRDFGLGGAVGLARSRAPAGSPPLGIWRHHRSWLNGRRNAWGVGWPMDEKLATGIWWAYLVVRSVSEPSISVWSVGIRSLRLLRGNHILYVDLGSDGCEWGLVFKKIWTVDLWSYG